MAKAKITDPPNKGVEKLSAPKRESNSSYKMTAEWKVPNDLVKDSSKRRATGLEIDWQLEVTHLRDPHKVKETSNEKKTSASINLDSFKVKNGSKTTTYTRDSFYPETDKKLKAVIVTVTPYNSKGESDKPQQSVRKFKIPQKPTIDKPTFNSGADGRIATTIKKVEGSVYQEQKNILYKRIVYDSSTKSKSEETYNPFSGASQSVSYDVAGYQGLSVKDYIKVTWEAWARGFAGKSEKAAMDFYVSYPAQATIKSIDASSKRSTGQLTVKIATGSSTEHPVDIVTLEYLANVIYEEASDIPAQLPSGSPTWEDGGAQDNGACTALTIPLERLIPEPGKHTWIRVKTARENAANSLYRYSAYKEIKELYTPAPTAEDDPAQIISLTTGDDGESIKALIGWNADGQDDSTGTELSWSDSEDTWRSTEEPKTHKFTWSDGRYPKTGTLEYHDSAEIVIKGLEEATTYYVKARRYLEQGDDGISYSPYSDASTCIPHKTPTSVFPICDRYIAAGSPLTVRWTLAGASLQTSWRIKTPTTVLAEGEGSIGSTQISWERLEENAVNNEITFTVEASTGSEYVASEERTVTIIEKPTLSLLVPPTMQAQSSFSITVTSSRLCNLILIVISQGASTNSPLGVIKQTDGDTIYSDKLEDLEWSSSGSSYVATISMPEGLDFWDLGHYTVLVTAEDRQTGLLSETVEGMFDVAWTNKAVSPIQLTYSATTDTRVNDEKAYYTYDSEQGTYNLVEPIGSENPRTQGWYEQTETCYVTLTPIDEVIDGFHRQAVQISLSQPNGSQNTDLYDIYRMDADHPTLIGENFPLSYETVDEYAPFGNDLELCYRVAIRTVDGDVEFADIPYTAPSKVIRFDWQGGALELPYNLSIGDGYSKDFEIRHHMDGSTDGYWNPNIERKASLSTSVIKIMQPDEIIKARQLARYAGPVFVRLPDGSAYEANVQVTDLSKTNDKITQIAIDAEEVGTTEEFMLPISTTLGA